MNIEFFRRAICSRLLVSILAFATTTSVLLAADTTKKTFSIPAETADKSLKKFTDQSGLELLYSTELAAGVKTNAVNGDLEPAEAISRLLAGTGLSAVHDHDNGVFRVVRVPKPPASAPPEKNVVSRTQPRIQSEASGVTDSLVLDTYQVTGSRLGRLEHEGPQPTSTFTKGDIEARGFVSTGDFLQSLPFNSGTTNSIGVPAANPVSNAPYARGAVTLNPRGLGANRFLVLIDGKRPSSYGLADNKGGAVFDFNSIPVEAIESIDYLKDGASAIYGSDAIAGVLNIKLKSAYTGLTTTAFIGNTLGHDTFTRSASLITGETGAKGSYLLNVNWFKQNSNFANDYSRSKSTDYSVLGSPRGQNNNSPSNFPFNITLTAAQATAAGFSGGAGFYVIAGGQPVANPSVGNFSRAGADQNAATNANRYEFAPATQLTPKQENFSALLNVKRTFSDSLRGSAQVLFNRNITNIVYTPISINSRSVTTSTGGFLTIPANNPYNPFGFALDNFRGRGNFGPLRTFDVDSSGLTGIFGLEGDLWADWKWDANLVYSYSSVDQVAGNQIRTDDMQAALNGTLRGFTGKFFNPFGPSSSQALVDSLFVNSNTNSKSTTTGAEISANGPLFEMPELLGQKSAGQVALAAGAEWRQDELDNHSDPVGYLVAVGDLPYRGHRTVTSGYTELAVPVLPKYLTLQLAGRYDRYDSFGSTVNPKYAVISQPFEFLKIRGSYSQSFKAPDIGQLYQPGVTTFTTAIADPRNPSLGLNTYPFMSSGNRNLKPEKGRVWYGGVVLDVNKWVKGLSFTFDYFDIGLTNVITSFTTPTVFFSYFPDRVVRNSDGSIQYFDARTINAAGYKWRGFDLGEERQDRRFARHAVQRFLFERSVFTGLRRARAVSLQWLRIGRGALAYTRDTGVQQSFRHAAAAERKSDPQLWFRYCDVCRVVDGAIRVHEGVQGFLIGLTRSAQPESYAPFVVTLVGGCL